MTKHEADWQAAQQEIGWLSNFLAEGYAWSIAVLTLMLHYPELAIFISNIIPGGQRSFNAREKVFRTKSKPS